MWVCFNNTPNTKPISILAIKTAIVDLGAFFYSGIGYQMLFGYGTCFLAADPCDVWLVVEELQVLDQNVWSQNGHLGPALLFLHSLWRWRPPWRPSLWAGLLLFSPLLLWFGLIPEVIRIPRQLRSAKSLPKLSSPLIYSYLHINSTLSKHAVWFSNASSRRLIL